MPAYALGMVGVALSASAAMSANPVTAGTAIVLAAVFLVLSVLIATGAVILGLVSMAQHGAPVEAVPSLTMIVPLMTVLGILTLRVTHGLVCPGVAFSVMMQFFINQGLVGAGLIAKFGFASWLLSSVPIAALIATVVLLAILNRKHFRFVDTPQVFPPGKLGLVWAGSLIRPSELSVQPPYQKTGSSKAATQRAGPLIGVIGAPLSDCPSQPSGCCNGKGAGTSSCVIALKPTRP
jgi:hypothetical protein